MALKKCPKCELNYIKGDAQYCDVCMRELKRVMSREKTKEDTNEVLICSECGEAPAVRGSELCAECLKERKRQVELENAARVDSVFDGDLDEEELDEEDLDEDDDRDDDEA